MADINVTVEETVIEVTVSGGPGPQGDQGIQGPQGDPGVFDPEDPVVSDTLTVLDDLSTPTKGYRLRASGSALDFEATGADLLISNWSGADFTGTQRSYDRLSADAMNVQHAGKREFVTSLYGPVIHTIDPDAGTASLGGKNSLSNIHVCGRSATAGPPTTGTWNTGDVVVDSTGWVWLCTSGGTPGTWSDDWAAPSLGANMSDGGGTAYSMGSRLEGDKVCLRGRITTSSTYTAGGTICTLAAAHWPEREVTFVSRSGGNGSATHFMTISTAGVVSFGATITTPALAFFTFDNVCFSKTV